MNIIGLGKVGCNIADHFGNYPQYNIYKIDRNIEGKRCYSLPDLQEPEEYEEFNPKTGNFYRKWEIGSKIKDSYLETESRSKMRFQPP